MVVEDACLISKVRANRKSSSASFCKPSPHPAVTACSACCIADTVWSVERGGCAVGEKEREGESVEIVGIVCEVCVRKRGGSERRGQREGKGGER